MKLLKECNTNDEFKTFFDHLHRMVDGVYRIDRQILTGGGFNLQVMFADFSAEFAVRVANDDNHHDPDKDAWTFRRSTGPCAGLISLYALFLCVWWPSHASNDFHFRYNHKVVFAYFKLQSFKKKHQRKHNSR